MPLQLGLQGTNMPLQLGTRRLGVTPVRVTRSSLRQQQRIQQQHLKALGSSRARGIPQDRRAGLIVPQAGFFESLTSSLKPNPAQPRKTAKSVFVAGSTGRVGARIVRELLEQGYSVRAGCRNVENAQEAIDVAEACGFVQRERTTTCFNLAACMPLIQSSPTSTPCTHTQMACSMPT